ncbi:MAG: hypothetical protein LBJ95_04195 [Oscillospiraceae bacterium]|jgi:hypothetical protein|nr:hypothetical protein [Oscillospiraceae bacterium]
MWWARYWWKDLNGAGSEGNHVEDIYVTEDQLIGHSTMNAGKAVYTGREVWVDG